MIDTELVVVTARQTPVASDLRLVLALIEVAHHSVLIANQFDLVSEQLRNLDAAGVSGGRGATTPRLSAMAHLAGSQLLRAVSAFASRDLARAQGIDVEDDEIDKLNREVFAAVTLEAGPGSRELALGHVLIARSIERIADNSVDIAEQAAFLVTAERRAELRAVLLYHVAKGKLTAAKVIKLHTIKTLNGQSLKVQVSHGTVTIGGARVISADVGASNGVIHVINKVLIPR